MTSEESVCQYIKNPSKGSVCQSRVYVNLDIYRSDDSYINISKRLVKKMYVSLECMPV